MSSPIIISLYYKGRQKDYKAIFTDNHSTYQFKVFIDNNIVNFEGSLEECFTVKNNNSKTPQQVDSSVLEAINQQLNQIFF